MPRTEGGSNDGKEKALQAAATSNDGFFKTYLLIFLMCGVAAVVLDFLFGVLDKAREFAQETVNSAVRSAVRAEVEAAAKTAQSSSASAAK